jgi:hypothetical protein
VVFGRAQMAFTMYCVGGSVVQWFSAVVLPVSACTLAVACVAAAAWSFESSAAVNKRCRRVVPGAGEALRKEEP